MWKLEYWCMTISRWRQALANRAQICGLVVAGARPVRSKKSTTNGSVRVAAHMSQSCRSRPRPKRSMTSLICCRSHSSRTISSVVGCFPEAAIGPFPSTHLAARTCLARPRHLLKRLRFDAGEHAPHIGVEIDNLSDGAGIVARFEIAELRAAEGSALHQPITAREQIGGGTVVILDRKA